MSEVILFEDEGIKYCKSPTEMALKVGVIAGLEVEGSQLWQHPSFADRYASDHKPIQERYLELPDNTAERLFTMYDEFYARSGNRDIDCHSAANYLMGWAEKAVRGPNGTILGCLLFGESLDNLRPNVPYRASQITPHEGDVVHISGNHSLITLNHSENMSVLGIGGLFVTTANTDIGRLYQATHMFEAIDPAVAAEYPGGAFVPSPERSRP